MAKQHQPPEDFDTDARDVWMAAQRQLRLQGTWCKTDVPLLEMYVRNVQAARQARIDAEKYRYGNTLELRGALKLVTDAESAALAIAKSLLLTADARKRHGISAPAKGEDELAALIR